MFENIEMPETIDEYITEGIKRGKRRKSSRLIKRTTGTIICLVLMLLVVGIRVSPVLAANVAKIPGLKYIVELVRFDKGLTSAIENDYIQSINKSCEKLGIVFTVKDIIADNSSIIVFYSIENKENYKWPHLSDPQILNSDGKKLEMSRSYGYIPCETTTYEGKIEFHFVNEKQKTIEIPDSVTLQTTIAIINKVESEEKVYSKLDISSSEYARVSETVLEEVWTVEFSIDKSKFDQLEKLYKINQSVEIEGQKILFEDIKIYPTKSILSVSFDKTNSKKLFAFEDFRIVDEMGQEWGRISSGMSGSYPSEYSQTLYFQSNYFHKPKELYITGSSIRALDKEKCYFTLDVANKQITSPYNLVYFTSLSQSDNTLSFSAILTKNREDIHNGIHISNEATDANGNKIEIVSSGVGTGTIDSNINYELKLTDNFKGPITFKINDYPTKIKEEFKVKIPLD